MLGIERLNKYYKVFIGNFGFGFFCITAYQMFFYLLLQIKYAAKSIHTLDIIAMTLFAILSLTFIGILILRPKMYS